MIWLSRAAIVGTGVTKMAEFYGGENEESSLTEALEKH